MRAMPSPAPPSPAPGQLRRRWPLSARRNPHDAEILRLAVPAFGALIAEPLSLFADSVIVGRLGTAPLGGPGWP
jgi:Na+-driven multidrug efflux pump